MKLTKAEKLSMILTALFILAAAMVIYFRPGEYRVEVCAVSPPPAQGQEPELSEEAPISINTASAEALDALPGIGPAIAGRIIAYREEHGDFAALEDITRVEGIGPETFEKIKPYITTSR